MEELWVVDMGDVETSGTIVGEQGEGSGSGKGTRPKRERGIGYPEPEYPTANIYKKLRWNTGNSAKGVAEHLVQGNNAVERAEKSGALERYV